MRIRAVLQDFLFEDLKGQKQKRYEFLLKHFQSAWHGVQGFSQLDKFIEHVANIDPSQNGAYMQWMVQRILKNPNENRVEDLRRVGKDLTMFEQFKSKLQNKDINAYKTFSDLYAAIQPFEKPKPLSKSEARLAKAKAGVTDIYKGPEGWIKIPTTRDAACFLGQNTRWCTAGKNSNMFDHYNKDDVLFVIYDSEHKSRHQLHLTSGQFADVTDKSQPMKNVPKWAHKPIVAWYKKNNPDLNIKQLMTLSGFDDGEGIEKGTAHEELMDLMKKYGVV